MKSIAIMQPVYMPWLGYFEQLAICDEFMFLDDVQYTKEDWRNRNKIRTYEGSMWLTIPVKKAKLEQSLLKTEISYGTNWQVKQLKAIKMNYERTQYFHEIFPIIEEAFEKCPKRLIDLTMPLTLKLADKLNIHTPINYASQIPRVNKERLHRIVELCHSRQAQILYTGPAAKSYMDEKYMKSKGIEIIYQNYLHPEYKQNYPGFTSHMAVIDLLMNHGPESRDILLSSPVPKELTSLQRTNE